jgi:hypothetical protein
LTAPIFVLAAIGGEGNVVDAGGGLGVSWSFDPHR